MKRLFGTILLCVGLLALPGCKSATAPAAPPAPGYINSADQQMGEIIAGATGFYNRLQTDDIAGTFKPTASEKASINGFGVSLNVAKQVYQQYHSGAATQAQAQAAVDTVKQQQSQIETAIPSEVKQ